MSTKPELWPFTYVTTAPDDDDFEDAFVELFPRAYRLARRIVADSGAAEDIAAETLARAYARWPKVHALPWRDGWVLRVAANLAIDTLRAGAATPVRALVAMDEDETTLRLALGACLEALPRRQRQAVTLRYLGGLTDREVAQALGISAGSVKTHIHRGLAALRSRLGPDIEEMVPNGLE